MEKKNTQIALGDIRGPLTDLLEKLSSDDAESWLRAFKKFLRKENPWEATGFPTWKTVKLGTGLETVDDFRRAFNVWRHWISNRANDILGKLVFTAADEETEVELVKLLVVEFGFKNGARRQEIYQRAKEFGLKLCSPEVALQLRLQYTDQPCYEWLFIAMEPITDSNGNLGVFQVGREAGERWLEIGHGDLDVFWDADRQLIFCK